MSVTRPYGTWPSPISAASVAAQSLRLGSVAIDGEDIYWLEGRPSEGGRSVLVRRTPDGTIADVTPSGFNVRTTVHEYGGGAYIVDQSTIYFSNFKDQQLYKQESGKEPQQITSADKMRYADGVIDRRRNLIFSVREDHTTSDRDAINTIVKIDLASAGAGEVIASGNDFYSSPRLSP